MSSENQVETTTSSSQPIQSSSSKRVPTISTKGLSVLVTGTVLVVALLRAEPKDIPKMIEILSGSSTIAWVGWTLAAAFLLCGVVLVWILMKVHEREVTRLASERDRLQVDLLNQKQLKD